LLASDVSIQDIGNIIVATNVEDALQEIDAQLADLPTQSFITDKRLKSVLLDQIDLSDTLKQQILGTTALNTVPADLGILPTKLSSQAVQPRHLGAGVPKYTIGKNLLDVSKTIIGTYINTTNGDLLTSSYWWRTDYLPILPSTAYVQSTNTNFALYDINKVFISGDARVSTTFTTPANAYFIRLSSDTLATAYQLELGSVATPYEAFKTSLSVVNADLGNNVVNSRTVDWDIPKLIVGKNIFDYLLAISGTYINDATGNLYTGALFWRSDYLPILPNTTYSQSTVTYRALYDVNQVFISGDHATNITFTTPSNARFIRVSYGTAQVLASAYQLELGAVATSFESFRYTVVGSIGTTPIIFPTATALTPIKNVNCVGDSLTQGAGATVAYPTVLGTLLTDRGVFKFGVGGENSTNISVRQGGTPTYIQPCTIPSGTTVVAVTLKDANGVNVLLGSTAGGIYGVNPCKINGITGTLSYSSGMLFTRSVAGTASTVARPVLLQTDIMLNHKNDIHVIWAGSNDGITANGITDTFYNIDDMIKSLAHTQYIVIGLTSLSYMSNIADIDVLFRKKYGTHFLGIRQYLLNYGLADAVITPTAQDNTDIANGEIPTSLRGSGDVIHLNDAGYAVVAQQVQLFGRNLGYWS